MDGKSHRVIVGASRGAKNTESARTVGSLDARFGCPPSSARREQEFRRMHTYTT